MMRLIFSLAAGLLIAIGSCTTPSADTTPPPDYFDYKVQGERLADELANSILAQEDSCHQVAMRRLERAREAKARAAIISTLDVFRERQAKERSLFKNFIEERYAINDASFFSREHRVFGRGLRFFGHRSSLVAVGNWRDYLERVSIENWIQLRRGAGLPVWSSLDTIGWDNPICFFMNSHPLPIADPDANKRMGKAKEGFAVDREGILEEMKKADEEYAEARMRALEDHARTKAITAGFQPRFEARRSKIEKRVATHLIEYATELEKQKLITTKEAAQAKTYYDAAF